MFKQSLETIGIYDENVTVIDFAKCCIRKDTRVNVEAFLGNVIQSTERKYCMES